APRSAHGHKHFRASKARLYLENLETRLAPASVFVVPLSQSLDNSHFHALQPAIAAAGNGGRVTIEPGAVPDLVLPVVVNQSGITIQGDPNVPGTLLPRYQLEVHAEDVTLTNLNLSDVQLGTAPGDREVSSNTISNCVIQALTEFGRRLAFTQNTVTSLVRVHGDGLASNELIAQNTFTSASAGLLLIAVPGTIVRDNTFLTQNTAINIEDCGISGDSTPTTVANNTIVSLEPGSSAVTVFQDSREASNVKIVNNAISTNGGIGLAMF